MVSIGQRAVFLKMVTGARGRVSRCAAGGAITGGIVDERSFKTTIVAIIS